MSPIRSVVPELPREMRRARGCQRCGGKGRLAYVLSRFSDGTGKLLHRWLCSACKPVTA